MSDNVESAERKLEQDLQPAAESGWAELLLGSRWEQLRIREAIMMTWSDRHRVRDRKSVV